MNCVAVVRSFRNSFVPPQGQVEKQRSLGADKYGGSSSRKLAPHRGGPQPKPHNDQHGWLVKNARGEALIPLLPGEPSWTTEPDGGGALTSFPFGTTDKEENDPFGTDLSNFRVHAAVEIGTSMMNHEVGNENAGTSVAGGSSIRGFGAGTTSHNSATAGASSRMLGVSSGVLPSASSNIMGGGSTARPGGGVLRNGGGGARRAVAGVGGVVVLMIPHSSLMLAASCLLCWENVGASRVGVPENVGASEYRRENEVLGKTSARRSIVFGRTLSDGAGADDHMFGAPSKMISTEGSKGAGRVVPPAEVPRGRPMAPRTRFVEGTTTSLRQTASKLKNLEKKTAAARKKSLCLAGAAVAVVCSPNVSPSKKRRQREFPSLAEQSALSPQTSPRTVAFGDVLPCNRTKGVYERQVRSLWSTIDFLIFCEDFCVEVVSLPFSTTRWL